MTSHRLACVALALWAAACTAARAQSHAAQTDSSQPTQSTARARIAGRLSALSRDGQETRPEVRPSEIRKVNFASPAQDDEEQECSGAAAAAADGEYQDEPAASEEAPSSSAPLHSKSGSTSCVDDEWVCPKVGCQPICCDCEWRNWVTVDYLFWWVEGAQTPPLLTTSPQGTPLADAGILGLPTTSLLFGNERIDNEGRSGGRIRFGHWLDDAGTVGFAGEFFGLANTSTDYVINSEGDPILARPFFDASTGMQNRQIDAYPGVIQGGKVIDSRNSLFGAGASALCNLNRCCWCCTDADCNGCTQSYRMSQRLDFVMGYRFLRMDDDFFFAESATIVNPIPLGIPVAAGTRLDLYDSFETENIFNGGELGLQWQRRSGRWSLDLLGKVALGNTRQKLYINGQTVATVPGGGSATFPGGFLALPTNIGDYDRDRFSVIPEFNINLGFALTPHLRARIGYTFLYWTNVLRATEQIDPVINPTQFPLGGGLVGDPRPAVFFNDADIWIQGLNAGLEFTW